MKKLYTFILAAASASMMFAQMPIMQHEVSFGGANPVPVSIEKADIVNACNQFKSAYPLKSKSTNLRHNAPSRADYSLTRDDLTKIDFVQDYTSYLVYAITDEMVEFCGDLYFTAGPGENDVIMTGLFGQQENNPWADVLSIKGTFDPQTQTVSFPYEQVVKKSLTESVLFAGFGYNKKKNETVDFTADDSLVLCVENYGGQYVLQCEGAADGTMDVIPYFGFLSVDNKGNGQGWYDIGIGQVFAIIQASVDINYKYIQRTGNGPEDWEVAEYDGKGLFNVISLVEGEEPGIQIGPFIQHRFGCPVMFTSRYGEYLADASFMVDNQEINNPAYMVPGNDTSYYFYLFELKENANGSVDEELGVFLTLNLTSEGYVESADFNCEQWCAMDEINQLWFGQCSPVHIEPCSFEIAGISPVEADKVQDGRWFNLQGIEVNKDMLQKGNIYINNGKKVLVK